MNSDHRPFLRFMAKTGYYIDAPVTAADCRLMYVLEGRGRFATENQSFELAPHTLIYYPPGVPYHAHFDSAAPRLFYTVNFDFTRQWHTLGVQPPTPLPAPAPKIIGGVPTAAAGVFGRAVGVADAVWAQEWLESMWREYSRRERGHAPAQESFLCLLLVELWRRVSAAAQNPLVEQIKKAVREEPSLNIQRLAARLNYHPYYLNAVFKKQEAQTLHRYIAAERLAAAKTLITSTEQPLESIALQCGFTSQSHMTAAFKQVYRISPAFLRRHM